MSQTHDVETVGGKITFSGVLSDIGQFFKIFNDPVASAARKFKKSLPEFYQSTADRIENAKELKYSTMFERDAVRYSKNEDGKPIKTPRGVLSAHWATKIMDSGGDLALTFTGTLPREDIALIRMGQAAGAGALPSTLRDLARISLLISRAKSIFMTSTFMGVLAIVIMLTVMIITPMYTVPMIKKTFVIPPEYIPAIAKKLFAFSDFIESYLLYIVGGVAMLLYGVIWSLPNYVGKYRKKLDQYFIWGLYRDLQGALFLAVLSTMVKKRGNVSDNLMVALQQMANHTTPWRRWHITKMIENMQNLDLSSLDNSTAITNALNTGIMDRESFFFLVDVQDGQGLAIGLQKAGERVEGPTLTSVQKQAKIIAMLLLGAAFGIVGIWVGAHLSTSKAMIDALKSFMSS
ncbi:type II secretion system F family protein [Polaromonas naphthalenivorans]|uniref:Putative general secretion pathway protein n=1 Tax=Polaromonas naphthalenivorans (strain CJ2) TaxID=365044 RepID=A1VV41_POLNA|nr:hypothetical protein [Polaromonas naphthalenivorans]ABM39519.1 putative general secretion pathway protein [Polaromonas naphthalenivorans CJ2]